MVEPTEEQPQGGPAPTPSPLDLGECVTGLANAVARGMEEQVAPYNLIPLEFAILRAFPGREEWTTTQLAKALPVTLSCISRIVTKLLDRDLLRRRRLRSDRRVVMLALTEEGMAMAQDLHMRVQAFDAMLSEGVHAQELAVFASVLSKVIANYTALQTGRNGSR